ncbi:LysR family transcriptional regulator [Marinomonas profundimaris]|uniref:Transcriptional regulator n=1 Tax=Marinomonas profundimaris TaxID=1208321 RepID=W1RXW4_9GAMM|nr:LysR family transcriptional regulator [Marinomonas profundimaris]ETI59678.1 transcriptional regulator [Marinomonas profundimaris]
MIHRVNLNLLRSLKVLLEERHVSRAAEKLNLTQSAVSRQLSQLRTLFSDPLLIREGNTLIPTPKALQLQAKLEHWFVELDDLLVDDVFDPKLWQGEFVLSSSDYVAQYLLPDIVGLLAEQAPQVLMTYHLWQPDLIQQLATSNIQLASSMSLTQPDGVSSIQIGEDNPVCVMRASHPLAVKEQITVADILDYAHIKVIGGGDKDRYVDDALAKLGEKRRIALNVPFFHAASQSLCQSDLLLVIPEHIARNLKKHFPIAYKPLPVTTPRHKYWLIWHAKYDNEPSHVWIRNLVLQVMSKAAYSINYDLKS